MPQPWLEQTHVGHQAAKAVVLLKQRDDPVRIRAGEEVPGGDQLGHSVFEFGRSGLQELPVGATRANTSQPRQHFDEESRATLSDSIRESATHLFKPRASARTTATIDWSSDLPGKNYVGTIGGGWADVAGTRRAFRGGT